MKIRIEVKTYEVHMLCDTCKDGRMLPTGKVLQSYPPWYEHKCSACGWMQTYREHFPETEYEQVL